MSKRKTPGTASRGTGSAGQSTRRSGARDLTVKVKTAKGRRLSSTRWLERQLNDPYVAAAQRDGYRSRAAYKFLDLNEKYDLVRRGQSVVDLGAAPGGWAQVMASLTGANDQHGAGKSTGRVFAIDILEMEPIPGVTVLHHDFMAEDAPSRLQACIGSKVHGVFSDMAAPTTGNRATDHLRTMGLCEAALDYALDVLEPGGVFACKVFQGGTEKVLLDRMKQAFRVVKHAKPPSSRKESREAYVVCLDFRGASKNESNASEEEQEGWSPL